MEYTFPDYYKEFRCVADECPDTCCAGWQIVIDKKALKNYREFPGGFGNRLYNSIDWKESVFKQYGKRCAFLNEHNLCDMYSEAGHDMLCRTCRRYPRHYEEFENLREISLSISCPVVAGMLLNREEKVDFQTVSLERDEETYEYFDFMLFTKLEDTRQLLVDVMQKRELESELRMAYTLLIAYRLQKLIQKEQVFDVDKQLERFGTLFLQKESFKNNRLEIIERRLWGYRSQSRYETMKKMFQCLYELEVLNPKWRDFLRSCDDILYKAGEDVYDLLYRNWLRYHKKRSIQTEQLMIYFMFTYFCGSVYDEHPLSKVKTAIFHTLMLQELEMAVFAKDNEILEVKQVDIVYRYAREIEHSDPNLERIERYMKKDGLFKMDNLLNVIMGGNYEITS